MERENRKPELIMAFANEHNFVAFFDSERFEIVCGSAGFFFDILEGEAALGSVVCNVEHCKFVRLLSSKSINNIISEVEMFFVSEADLGAKTVAVFFCGNEFVINALGIVGTVGSVGHDCGFMSGGLFLRSKNDCIESAVVSAYGNHSVRSGAVEIDTVAFVKDFGVFADLDFKTSFDDKIEFLAFVGCKCDRTVFSFFAVFVYNKKRFGNSVAEIGSHVVIDHSVGLFDFLSLAGSGNGISAKLRALAFDDIGDINAKA